MYIPLDEMIIKEKYQNFTKRKLESMHRKGFLKTITGERGKLLTSENWLEEAIELEAINKLNTSRSTGKIAHNKIKNFKSMRRNMEVNKVV